MANNDMFFEKIAKIEPKVNKQESVDLLGSFEVMQPTKSNNKDNMFTNQNVNNNIDIFANLTLQDNNKQQQDLFNNMNDKFEVKFNEPESKPKTNNLDDIILGKSPPKQENINNQNDLNVQNNNKINS